MSAVWCGGEQPARLSDLVERLQDVSCREQPPAFSRTVPEAQGSDCLLLLPPHGNAPGSASAREAAGDCQTKLGWAESVKLNSQWLRTRVSRSPLRGRVVSGYKQNNWYLGEVTWSLRLPTAGRGLPCSPPRLALPPCSRQGMRWSSLPIWHKTSLRAVPSVGLAGQTCLTACQETLEPARAGTVPGAGSQTLGQLLRIIPAGRDRPRRWQAQGSGQLLRLSPIPR